MSEENKIILIKRLKSLGWRLGCYVAVSLIAFGIDALKLFNIPPEVVAIIALIAGEATKAINNQTEIFGARLK